MEKKEITLLIVEDDENILSVTAHELKNTVNYILNDPINVSDVDTLDEAHLYIDSERPDIVILDVFLKDGQNTQDLVARCNNHGLKPFWILHSSEWQYEDTKAKFAALGVTRGVNKLDFDGIRAIIAEYQKNPSQNEEKQLKPSKFHEIPQGNRLEEFYDYLMNFTTIDLALQAYLQSNPSTKLEEIERNLFKEIEKLRDFVLYE